MERPSKKEAASEASPETRKKSIVFFHPDLGIGGAERLVVDAAFGLQNLGHKVTIFTSYRDPGHCFDEARDGTLDVRVRGNNVFPATILGRFKILCSILRQLHLLTTITWTGELATLSPSVFFLDQLSAGIPFLRWYWEDVRILFYCHFPDLLLVQNRTAWHRRIWRVGFDWLESWSIRGADRVIVNSAFTKGVVEQIWPGLGGESGIGVVYPCVNTESMSKANGNAPEEKGSQEMWKGKKVLLSINRFERKKDVALAIKAFGGLTAKERESARLVIAGGYDLRVQENVAYHKELESLSDALTLKSATAKNIVSAQAIPNDIEVLFLLSVPDQLKTSLLRVAKILIYTPSNEHFGIVPLEAMLAGVPVLAANSGGPLETVVDVETGWLRPKDNVSAWEEVLRDVLSPERDQNLAQLGKNGKRRVETEFSEDRMARHFEEELDATMKGPHPQATELGDVATALVLYLTVIGTIAFVIREGLKPQISGTTNKATDYALGAGIISTALAGAAVITWKLMQNESAFS
ncbi:uncharacterized protein KY384_007820 [Bacidia gigantensis]|uniref:uncharacterized protein n=1 Tax=Bacidia gigantensis TaxID=2732470 RepID=UPI001D04E825|nr:uncharacterized protein KY384_007820 [Bacidia gigantensis]KAG8527667.1 hypothetical protein KY384_007820 [Bacidia gigantensis]